MTSAPSLHQALVAFASAAADCAESSPSAPERLAARRLESLARREAVELDRQLFPRQPLALHRADEKRIDRIVSTLASRCPECGAEGVEASGVERIEHDEHGDEFTVPVKAMECSACGYGPWEV